jgi:hypothetical protein
LLQKYLRSKGVSLEGVSRPKANHKANGVLTEMPAAAEVAAAKAAHVTAAEAAHVAEVSTGEMTATELAAAEAAHVAEVSAGEMTTTELAGAEAAHVAVSDAEVAAAEAAHVAPGVGQEAVRGGLKCQV